MISWSVEMSDLSEYATRMLKNDASRTVLVKVNKMPLRVRRMELIVQGVAFLSLISSNVEGRGLGIHRVTRSSYIHGHPQMLLLFICIHSRKRKRQINGDNH